MIHMTFRRPFKSELCATSAKDFYLRFCSIEQFYGVFRRFVDFVIDFNYDNKMKKSPENVKYTRCTHSQTHATR